MNVGELKNRITIQKREKLVDESGYKSETWIDYCNLWCAIKELYGKELYEAMAVKMENTLKFIVRYNKKLSDINTKDFRVIMKKNNGVIKFYDINHIDYMNYGRELIIIKAMEVI